MKKSFVISAMVIFLSSGFLSAQNTIKVSVDNDGIPLFEMEVIHIVTKGPSRKESKHYQDELKKFNRLRYNVLKVWPYAVEAAKNLKEIDVAMKSITSDAQRKAYMKSKENSLFGKYEKDLRDLNFSQGKILIKLVDRQTGQTTYALVKDLKNGASAFFWQSIGRVFGYNLKQEYNPEEDDFAIEMICKSIESGQNSTYYDLIRQN